MQKEFIDVVNEHDEVVGVAEREELYTNLLKHRIVHVLIFNTKGEMALQMRSEHKSFCPHHWSTAVGGHVHQGETTEQAAVREFQEEMGVVVPFTFAFKDYYKDPHNPGLYKFITTYTCVYEGPFEINPLEVTEVRYFKLKELRTLIKNGGKFHPELAYILEKHYSKA